MEEELKITCDRLRREIMELGEITNLLKGHSDFDGNQAYVGQHDEMKANMILSYRHLEDARMRIGKVLQAAGDGVSILDKPPH